MMANTILKTPLISTLIISCSTKNILLKPLKPSVNSSLINHICNCTSNTPYVVSQREPQIRSPQLVALEYADLSIPHIVSEEGAVRMRQHVNPLSSTLSIPVEPPNWNDVFEDPKLPLVVDIGSGSGRFLMWLAKRNPGSKNYMGLEIRKKLVTRAETWAKELGLNNIHFLLANASISFKQLISTYPGPLMLVSVSCPDPHFKKRHHKRRIVQKPLAEAIVDELMPGGQVFIQSDVLEVAIDMRKYFDEESEKLTHVDGIDSNVLCDNEGWLLSNPMGIRTEREIHAEYEGNGPGMGTMLAGGAAAAYGVHQLTSSHGHGGYNTSHGGHNMMGPMGHYGGGKFKHGNFKHGKHGKRGKFVKHKGKHSGYKKWK